MTSTVTDSDPLAPYTLLYIYGGCCCVRALFQPTPRFSSFVSRERERAKEKGPLSIIWRRRDHGPIIPSSPSISIPAYPLRRAWPSLFFCPSGLPLAARSIPSVLLPFSFLSLSLCVYTFNFRRRYTITHTERRGNLQFHGNFLSIPFGQSVWFDLSTPWIPKNRTFGNYVSQLWTGQSKLFA